MAATDRLLTESELSEWVLRRLGHPVLKVELTKEHVQDAVMQAKRWFAAKKGVERKITIKLHQGQVEYDMPEDCDAVLDVSFEVSPLDISLIFAPHIIADEKIPYNVFAAPSSVGLYSSFVQSLQYIQMAHRVLGSDTNWLFLPYEKKLLAFARRGSHAIVEYKSNLNVIEQLPERDHDMLKRYTLAVAKKDLGMIRSKYRMYPTAQGQNHLNGEELIKQGDQEIERLEDEIFATGMPMPFIAE